MDSVVSYTQQALPGIKMASYITFVDAQDIGCDSKPLFPYRTSSTWKPRYQGCWVLFTHHCQQMCCERRLLKVEWRMGWDLLQTLQGNRKNSKFAFTLAVPTYSPDSLGAEGCVGGTADDTDTIIIV